MNEKCSIRRIALKLGFFLILLTQPACRGQPSASDLNYLVEDEYQCYSPSQDRLDFVQGKLPSGFIKGYPAQQMPIVYNRLALLSDRDLNYLINNYNTGILRGISPGGGAQFGIAGVTTLTSGSSPRGNAGLVATSITTGSNLAGFALQHEVGHAVEILGSDYALDTEYRDFESSINRLFSEVRSRSDIRSYAKSAPAEAWAEAYANFYCSPESNSFIQRNLPFTFAFLRAVLVPPVWETLKTDNSAAPNEITGKAETKDLEPDERRDLGEDRGFSGFLDQVIEILKKDPPIGQVGDGTSPTESTVRTSQSNQRNNDMTIAVSDFSEKTVKTGLMVSTSKEIERVEICIGAAQACAEDSRASEKRRKFRFTNFRRGENRNFFSLQTIKSDQEEVFQSEWYLFGYDSKSELISRRRIKIWPR